MERFEQICITAVLDKKKSEKYREQICKFVVDPGKLGDMDALTLTYTFGIEYHNCVERMEALTTIINDHEVTIKADLKTLNHMKCVIGELISAIERRV